MSDCSDTRSLKDGCPPLQIAVTSINKDIGNVCKKLDDIITMQKETNSASNAINQIVITQQELIRGHAERLDGMKKDVDNLGTKFNKHEVSAASKHSRLETIVRIASYLSITALGCAAWFAIDYYKFRIGG